MDQQAPTPAIRVVNGVIQDADGWPLPAELQRGRPVYRAVLGAVSPRVDAGDWSPDALSDELMLRIRDTLFPLPTVPDETDDKLVHLIRVACYDPGRFTARGEGFTEELWRWQARAVQIVVEDPSHLRTLQLISGTREVVANDELGRAAREDWR